MWESDDKATLIFQGALVIALFGVACWPILATVHYAGIFTYETFGIDPQARSPISEVIRNLGLIIVSIFAIAIGGWRAVTAHRQARTAERGHFTERFTASIDNIKDPQLSIRLGGIYALSQLGEEATGADYESVIAIFCAFVRSPPGDAATRAAALTAELTALRAFSNTSAIASPKRRSVTQTIRRDVHEIMGRLSSGNWLRKNHFLELSGADLSGADLSGADLSGADLSGADLSGAYLRKVYLSGANLSEADLSGATLRWADLRKAGLSGADLSEARLSKADLSGASFYDADLSGANFREADLSGASLYDAVLSRTVLIEANLSGADLRGADLTQANLRGAKLSRADLNGTRLSKADLSGASFDDANLSGANLRGAKLSRADLNGTRLSKADLSGASFDDANLSGANLREANLRGAKLSRVDLNRADFTGSIYLTQAQLDTACAAPEHPPVNLPTDEAGNQLIWRGKACP